MSDKQDFDLSKASIFGLRVISNRNQKQWNDILDALGEVCIEKMDAGEDCTRVTHHDNEHGYTVSAHVGDFIVICDGMGIKTLMKKFDDDGHTDRINKRVVYDRKGTSPSSMFYEKPAFPYNLYQMHKKAVDLWKSDNDIQIDRFKDNLRSSS